MTYKKISIITTGIIAAIVLACVFFLFDIGGIINGFYTGLRSVGSDKIEFTEYNLDGFDLQNQEPVSENFIYDKLSDKYEFKWVELERGTNKIIDIVSYQDRLYIAMDNRMIYIFDNKLNFINSFNPEGETGFISVRDMDIYNNELYICVKDSQNSETREYYPSRITVHDLNGDFKREILYDISMLEYDSDMAVAINHKNEKGKPVNLGEITMSLASMKIIDGFIYMSSDRMPVEKARIYKMDMDGNITATYGTGLLGTVGASHIDGTVSFLANKTWHNTEMFDAAGNVLDNGRVLSEAFKQKTFFIINQEDIISQQILPFDIYTGREPQDGIYHRAYSNYIDFEYSNGYYYILSTSPYGLVAVHVLDIDFNYIESYELDIYAYFVSAESIKPYSMDISSVAFSNEGTIYIGDCESGLIVGERKGK